MKKTLSIVLITLLLLTGAKVAFFYLPSPEVSLTAQAADNTEPEFPKGKLKIIDWTGGRLKKISEEAGYGENPVVGLLVSIVDWLLVLGSYLAVIAIIYSGLMYITSTGNPEKAQKAKRNLIWAIIAIVVILACLALPQWIYDILEKEGP